MNLQNIQWKLHLDEKTVGDPHDWFKAFATWIPDSPELILTASATDATGLYVMPVSGGTPELIVTAANIGSVATLDAQYVYFKSGLGLLRVER
jgi:hypothetical protein